MLSLNCAEGGVLYLWGFGENIHPKNMDNIVSTPRVVDIKEPVKKAACGQSHVLVLTEKGDVYAFGNGGMGQLGHGATRCALWHAIFVVFCCRSFL